MQLRKLVAILYQKILAWLHTTSPGAVQFTGVLGLALLLLGFYQYRNNNSQQRNAGSPPIQTPASSPPVSERPAQSNDAAKARQPTESQADTPTGRAVQSKLAGVKTVTISAPGVLFHEWHPSELQDSAIPRPDVVPLMREVCRFCDTYIIANVDDDVGQAVVAGALEAAGVVGQGAGRVAPHRLLFCSTVDGKVSMVRQLDPDLHIDGHPGTVEDLKRFMPRLLHVQQPGSAAAALGSTNVMHADSMMSYFMS